MTTWEAIFLGIIQGLTEFLPISSSGHLELSQYLLGFEQLHRYVFFNLICHLGTLFAIFYVFASQIKQAFIQRERTWQILLGTLPLFPLVLILKPIKAVFDQPQYLGWCFLLSALFLFLGSFYQLKSIPDRSKLRWKDVLTIGLFQAVAVLPGVSRSGTTISTARLLGWQKEEAMTFSFLLAIPAILGGITLESIQLFKSTSTSFLNPSALFWGFATSFLTGCLALWLLKRIMLRDGWHYFAWYCLAIGLLTTAYFYL